MRASAVIVDPQAGALANIGASAIGAGLQRSCRDSCSHGREIRLLPCKLGERRRTRPGFQSNFVCRMGPLDRGALAQRGQPFAEAFPLVSSGPRAGFSHLAVRAVVCLQANRSAASPASAGVAQARRRRFRGYRGEGGRRAGGKGPAEQHGGDGTAHPTRSAVAPTICRQGDHRPGRGAPPTLSRPARRNHSRSHRLGPEDPAARRDRLRGKSPEGLGAAGNPSSRPRGNPESPAAFPRASGLPISKTSASYPRWKHYRKMQLRHSESL